MGRPTTIKDETIIAAAREVFLEKGVHATTAEVAARAGVSEGTLFNRFNTKFDLFRAAMSPTLEEPAWMARLNARVGQGDLRESLILLGHELIEFYRSLMPLIMMSWSNQSAAGLPEVLMQP